MTEKPNFKQELPERDKVPFRRDLAEQTEKLEAKSSAGRWLALAIKRTGEGSIQD